jgi:dethiobiotin synthase
MAKLKGIFVTGTDTGIGKTYVSRLLVQALSDFGPVTYQKPVQTGCLPGAQGSLRAPDFEFVKQSGKLVVADELLHVPYRFPDACSPHLAAERSHARISIGHIRKCFDALSATGATVIVEGAGGVYVPLNERQSMVDLMQELGLPIVLVSSPRVGTLNHTFLSIEALVRHGLRVAGIMINAHQEFEKDFIYCDNLESIRNRAAPVPVLEIPYKADSHSTVKEFCHELTKRYF